MERSPANLSRDVKDFGIASGFTDALEKARELLASGDLQAAAEWLRMAADMVDTAAAKR